MKKESAYSEELNRMSAYEALTKIRYNQFRYCDGKNYSRSNRYITIRTNSVTFMSNKVNGQPVTYCLRELRVRERGNTVHIVDRSGKIVITFSKSS